MDGRDLVRSVKLVGTVRGLGLAGPLWGRRRTDAWGPRRQGAARARVPGGVTGAEPQPGGGVMRFARSELRVMVAAGGAVFWGWDGADPEPSYALEGACPEPDPRAELEPDKDGGWQVVSERLTVAVSRVGAVEVRTPGGAVLRRDLPPRWWEPVDGGPARWLQRGEVPADARFFGLGGRPCGVRLRDGTYPLVNSGRDGGPARGVEPRSLAMPVHVVVSDAGTHLVFHDTASPGRMTLREGEEGAGSGHDRPGTSELRMDGGPLRCWVVAGTPARVLRGWTALTGAPVLPPPWALGPQHVWQGAGGEREARRIVAGFEERGVPLSALHVEAVAGEGWPGLAAELGASGVRVVSAVPSAVRARPWSASSDGARARVLSDERNEGVSLPSPSPGGGAAAAPVRAGQGARGDGRSRERPFLFSGTGWAGEQRYGGTCAGDVPAGWPGMRSALSLVLGLGLCGVPFSGTDVGGSSGTPSPELYVRWFQMSAHLPLLRTRDTALPGPGAPWRFGPQVLGHVRAALAERERLRPYFVTLSQLARLTGAPYARPVWWAAPADRALRACEDAFLLGDCLLVAPVMEPGADRRSVRLPRGRWYDTATGRAYEGQGRVLLDAPLSRIPVLARAGAVIPVCGDDGGPALDVWAPAAGRTGGGLMVTEAGDGSGRTEIERFTTRMSGGRVVVERKGGGDVGLPVRVRGC
ncbi:hypothetical protein GCM10009730_23480 [Streptomyces albidochromogenes]|uniref:glycoside hydrolase family 31 protein n=1 Tax=Streptomyces albidochromogenes TaxID=329524 RepID=UPI002FEA7A9C